MLDQIASGERDQSVLGPADRRRRVQRWRSLAVLHPQLMDEWHPTRNRDLDPYKVGQYSRLKIWWRCRECGHDWRATPHDRAFSGRGCPVCGRRRSIAATIERNRRAEVRRERTLRSCVRTCWRSGTRRAMATRSAQDRGGIGAHRLVALQHRPLRPGMEGDGREQDKTRHAWVSALRASIRRASGGPARSVTDHSERFTPIGLTNGTRPRTVGSTLLDQARIGTSSVVAVRVLRTGLAGAGDVPPAQRAWRLPNMCDPDGARGRASARRRSPVSQPPGMEVGLISDYRW